jgi:glycosyltransferase involved in cell wall biosynthesis
LKIAHIVLKTIPFGGGVEKYVEEIGPRLVQMGHEVIVYTMSHYGHPPAEYKGMKIKPIRAIGTKSAEKITSSLLATLDLCLREKADIVHYHAFTNQVPFLPKFWGIPVVVQGHGIEWKRSRWNWLGKGTLLLSEKICVYSADRLTVVSQTQREYLMEKYEKESVYIPTGVNPPIRRKALEITRDWKLGERDYILSAGRLVPEKGLHYLIQAFRALNSRMKLVIAGSSLHEKAYEDNLRRLAGDDPRILFTGHVTGMKFEELMSNAYAFVLPSELEGLPTVLLEAMSYGNCCIASDILENREALRDQGLTFISRSTGDLKAQLEKVSADPELASRYRKLSAEGILASHDWDRIAEQFHSFYQTLRPDLSPKKAL